MVGGAGHTGHPELARKRGSRAIGWEPTSTGEILLEEFLKPLGLTPRLGSLTSTATT
jgi:hypothetical protein